MERTMLRVTWNLALAIFFYGSAWLGGQRVGEWWVDGEVWRLQQGVILMIAGVAGSALAAIGTRPRRKIQAPATKGKVYDPEFVRQVRQVYPLDLNHHFNAVRFTILAPAYDEMEVDLFEQGETDEAMYQRLERQVREEARERRHRRWYVTIIRVECSGRLVGACATSYQLGDVIPVRP